MRVALTALSLLLSSVAPSPAGRPLIAIRATTAAIVVTGGAEDVSATLYDAAGAEIDGLVLEREASRSTVVLAATVTLGARIEVRVPRAADLRIEASNGGPVAVRDVHGQLEVVNSNAAIVLDRVGGTVLASTSNGPIDATLVSVEPTLPMSFLTSNAAITVTLPDTLEANLRMESDTGPLTTDFVLAGHGGGPAERKVMRGGRLRTIISGAVNGGGPEIDFRTENAAIVVRRQK
jgi:hypothetical protein